MYLKGHHCSLDFFQQQPWSLLAHLCWQRLGRAKAETFSTEMRNYRKTQYLRLSRVWADLRLYTRVRSWSETLLSRWTPTSTWRSRSKQKASRKCDLIVLCHMMWLWPSSQEKLKKLKKQDRQRSSLSMCISSSNTCLNKSSFKDIGPHDSQLLQISYHFDTIVFSSVLPFCADLLHFSTFYNL